jgi:hypothetical protein
MLGKRMPMNRYCLIWLCCPLLLITSLTFAEPVNFWKCEAEDITHKSWVVQHEYRRVAITISFDQCKKESTEPRTCRTSKTGCYFFADGIDMTPLWRCMALDQLSKTWYSNLYTTRDDAALGARSYCQQRSGFPDTCYVNLLTCKTIESKNNKPQ